jgi:hydroxymethylpyrimidine pyrophosphatase-like HAD family hydrolase
LEKIDWIILDVDGVLLGDKQDFNYPHPHNKVIEALAAIRKSGVQVTLCTGKPSYSLDKIVRAAHCGQRRNNSRHPCRKDG